MNLRAWPALLPAVAIVAGTASAPLLPLASVPCAILVSGLGLALGRTPGRTLAACGLAMGVAWSQLPGSDEEPKAGRPIVLVARAAGAWSRTPFGWSLQLHSESYFQGRRMGRWRQRLSLGFSGERPPEGGRFRIRSVLRKRRPPANHDAGSAGPWSIHVKSGALIEALPPSELDRPRAWGRSLRRRLQAACRRAGETRPGMAMVRSLALGERTALPEEWLRGLRRTGLAHLIALSGLHVGILAGAAALATRGLPRPARVLTTVSLVWVFLLVNGSRPALLRACLMATLFWSAPVAQRAGDGRNALCLVAGVLLLGDPSLILDLGYQLTVSSTAGLLFLAPVLDRRWIAIPWRPLRLPLAASVSAIAAALPWSLPVFHLFTPLAPLWNLLALPWAALALVASLAWSGMALVSPGAADWLLAPLDALAGALALPAMGGPRQHLTLGVGIGWPRAAAVAILLITALLRLRRWPLLLLALVLVTHASDGGSDQSPELRLLDVGQGESILLRHGRSAVLVDGGGWQGGDVGQRVLVPALRRAGVTRLRAAILSHNDFDHCGGLLDLASYVRIDELWTAPVEDESRCSLRLRRYFGDRVREISAGHRLDLGTWRMRVLHPPRGPERWSGNNGSLVLVAEARGLRVLLTGDIEKKVEDHLLAARGADEVRARVLKVAHHGSRTSSSERWLDAVRPALALISAGPENRYGHPAEETLTRLARRSLRPLRTDRDGQIVIEILEGARLRLRTPGAPPSEG